MWRIIITLFVIGTILLPITTIASECSDNGYTIIYVNGVFTDRKKAEDDLHLLDRIFSQKTSTANLIFRLGFNSSHLAGAGDIAQVVSQALGSSISSFDRDTILMQIHPQVSTRRILLVGHSQGTFYTNELYEYLIQNGVPKESIAVFNLATPASFVSGNGPYLTSANDNLIRAVREWTAAADVVQPLPSNTLIPISRPEVSELWRGHSFSGEYLAGASAKIIYTISNTLDGLAVKEAVETESGCFTPPPEDFSYRMKSAAFAVADPFALATRAGAEVAGQRIATIAQDVAALASVGYSKVAAIFNVASVFYGSSVTSADLETDLEASLPSEGEEAIVAEQPSQAEQESELAPSAPVAETEVAPETNNSSSEPPEDFSDASFSNNSQQNPVRDPFGLIAIPLSSTGAGGGINDAGANATSSSQAPTVPQDTTGPDLTFSINECSNSLSSGCLSTSTTATLVWSSAASDLASYELFCAVGSAACAGFPKNFSATSSVSQSETLTDFTVYSFTLKAVDSTGNQTSVSRSIESASRPVVINEVAWMGTASSTEDEWIELKNNTSQVINFGGKWVLRTADNAPYIILSGSIPASGHYLLERTDDLTVKDIAASQIFGNDGASWALNNTGENALLEFVSASATSTMDEIPLCSNWCAGSNDLKRTMERIDSLASGQNSNWATALGEFILNGHDASGAAIGGTPKAKNSASYLARLVSISGGVRLLKKQNSPYLIDRSGLTISQSETLTVEPGVVVKIVSNSEPKITVNGTINAGSTTDGAEPAVFTAFEDDTYGGDLNADGVCEPGNASSTAECPSPGIWMNIIINSSSQNSSFSNTLIRYGGRWFTSTPSNLRALVAVDNTSVTFASTTIEHSKKHGLYLSNSASQISGSTFRSNGDSGDNNDAAGIYSASSSPSITSSTFASNRYGLYLDGSPQASVSSSVFNNNAVEAVHISIGQKAIGSFSSNSASGNGVNGIVLRGAISSNGTTTLAADSLPYVIRGVVDISASSTLSFGSGAVLKGYPNLGSDAGKLTVKNGAKLFFDGASASDLVFTSLYDDSIGGDTDNAVNSASAGDWYGIVVENGGRIQLKGFSLRYAGGLTGQIGDNKGAINVDQGSGSIDSALLANNFQNGVRLNNVGSFSVMNSIFQNHAQEITSQAAALYVVGSTVNLENITFSANDLDIRASGAYSVTCTNCGSPVTSPDPL